MLSLRNKTAIVTGAASGLGKEIALLFAKQGANVIAIDYNQQTLAQFMSELPQGSTVTSVTADISNKDDVKKVFENSEIDILINNAGVMDKLDPVGDVSDEIFDRVININLKGTFYMMREAIKIFQKKKAGVIVNIASIGGLEGGRAGAAYTASKHGVVGLTKNTAYFYAKSGIRCNAVAPGAMNTNIMSGSINLSTAGKLIKSMLSNQGNQKIGDPMEVAQAALFLASDEASFINGAILVADGGWSTY